MAKFIYASSSRYDLISHELDEDRVKPSHLVFVPSSRYEYVFKERQEKELIERLNLNTRKITSLTDEMSTEQWQETLLDADVIYLHGGNPVIFYEYIIEKGVEEILKEFDKTMIGLSAGAMLLSQRILLTPSNDEYTEFVNDPSLNRSPLNIFPHMNFKEVVSGGYETMDGLMKITDLMKLSFETPVDLLADDHFIVVENDQIRYYGDYFYRLEQGQLRVLIDDEFKPIDIIPTQSFTIDDVHILSNRYVDMNTAIKQGYLSTLFGLNEKSSNQIIEFSLLAKPDIGYAYKQADMETFKSWYIEHPEFKYATLSYKQVENQIIERLTFRTRYLKIIEKIKVIPKL